MHDSRVPHEITKPEFKTAKELIDTTLVTYRKSVAFNSFGCDVTFGEIDEIAMNLAAFLQANFSIKKGDRVAVMLPNIIPFPVTFIALVRLGAIQVNVNPFYTAPELEHQLRDSGAETIVILADASSVLAEIVQNTSVTNIVTVGWGDCIESSVASPQIDPRLAGTVPFSGALDDGRVHTLNPVEATANDILFLQYTGGTTGVSKGATLRHHNFMMNLTQFKAVAGDAFLPGQETIVTIIPLYHIFALMANFITYFSLGAKNILISDPKNLDGLIETIKDAELTAFSGVNTLFAGLLEHPATNTVNWSKLRVVLGGGAPVFESVSDRWYELTGRHIIQGYGLSETSPLLSINSFSKNVFSNNVGLPVPSTDIILLDSDDKHAPAGQPGEICASGPQVMDGYWNNDNVGVYTSDGYFRTGDIGIFNEDGELSIVDRKKDMVLVSGFNVYPNEIEEIVSSLDDIMECACVGVPDHKTGEALKLYVVTRQDSRIDAAEIMKECSRLLVAYKVPKHIVFIEALPKSAVGKILRRKLRDE